MDNDFLAKMSRVYAKHPLTAASVLRRVRRQKGTLDGLTEMDLAVDDRTGLTDQNHLGGAEAVRAIARAVVLREGDRVLDVGTGLGGAPRLLAHLYGCRCHGVELTESRFNDAVQLTRLVRLERRVTFTQGDFLTVAVPGGPFDLILGQGAFMHFPDHGRLLGRCAGLLRPGGWLAVEEAYLRRAPAGGEEARLEELLDCWNGGLHPLRLWDQWVRAAGLARPQVDDFGGAAERELRRQVRLASEGAFGSVTESELRGWRLGAELIAAGLIGMMRLLAQKGEQGSTVA